MKKIDQNILARAVCLAQGIGKPRQVDIARMKESLRCAFIEMTSTPDGVAVIHWASREKSGRAIIEVLRSGDYYALGPSLFKPSPSRKARKR